MRAVFIVNPAAGHRRGWSRWEHGRALAARLWPDHEVRVTQGPGHGRELARAAILDGAGLIVAVGGDGTVGEAVDGVLSISKIARGSVALAAFPVGSGCDFARHMGVPRSPRLWAAAMGAASERRIDAARATFRSNRGEPRSRYFLNVAALGLAGDVAVGVEKRGKSLGGTLTYFLEGLRAVAGAQARKISLIVDGRKEEPADYHLIAAANTSTIGGGMRLAPQADVQDGLLDVLTVGNLTKLELLKLMPKVYAGRHLGAPGIVLRRARRLEVLTESLPLNIDGDLDGTSPVVFEALPQAISFLI